MYIYTHIYICIHIYYIILLVAVGTDLLAGLSAFSHVEQRYHEFGSPRLTDKVSADCLLPIG